MDILVSYFSNYSVDLSNKGQLEEANSHKMETVSHRARAGRERESVEHEMALVSRQPQHSL